MDKQLIEPATDKPPLDPTQVPTRGLSREQKRHIRRAMGTAAADMVGDILHKATAAYVSQQAVAREVLELAGRQQEAERKLHTRVDGVAAWSETNEKELGAVRGRLDAAERLVSEYSLQLQALRKAGIVRRVLWLVFGVLPR